MTETRSWRGVERDREPKNVRQPPETEEVKEVFFSAASRNNTALPTS